MSHEKYDPSKIENHFFLQTNYSYKVKLITGEYAIPAPLVTPVLLLLNHTSCVVFVFEFMLLYS
jgi:hypothetical protein